MPTSGLIVRRDRFCLQFRRYGILQKRLATAAQGRAPSGGSRHDVCLDYFSDIATLRPLAHFNAVMFVVRYVYG